MHNNREFLSLESINVAGYCRNVLFTMNVCGNSVDYFGGRTVYFKEVIISMRCNFNVIDIENNSYICLRKYKCTFFRCSILKILLVEIEVDDTYIFIPSRSPIKTIVVRIARFGHMHSVAWNVQGNNNQDLKLVEYFS